MPFFQGAYDFDISGPVQMNDGSAVGHVFGAGQNPGQATQHVQPQQSQKSAPAHQPASPLAYPQTPAAPVTPSSSPANAVFPTSIPMLIPVQQGAQPQYLFPGNPQPYVLVYAPVSMTQGGILAPVQAGYLAQPPQVSGLPYYLVPQGGYQPTSYLTPTQIPTGPDNRSLNTSASPSINSEGATAAPSPPLMYASPVPVNGFPVNGSAHAPAPSPPPGITSLTPSTFLPVPGFPLSSNSTNHSATSVVAPPVPATPIPSPDLGASSALGVSSVPGQSPSLVSTPNPVPQSVILPMMQPTATPSPAPQVVTTAAEQPSNQPKRKKKSWISRVFRKRSSKKYT